VKHLLKTDATELKPQERSAKWKKTAKGICVYFYMYRALSQNKLHWNPIFSRETRKLFQYLIVGAVNVKVSLFSYDAVQFGR